MSYGPCTFLYPANFSPRHHPASRPSSVELRSLGRLYRLASEASWFPPRFLRAEAEEGGPCTSQVGGL
eukprot:1826893-Rhodomonas_salina.1